jgi:cell division protein FtsQ
MAAEKSKKSAGSSKSAATEAAMDAAVEKENEFSQWLRRGVMACGVVLGLAALIFAQGATEQYLMRDGRFHLARAVEYGEAPPNLQIEGLHYASREAVQRVFEGDLGRSVYLLPVKQRRLELMGIPWVKDATVSRLWPNRVSVRVQERKPLAFVKRRGGAEATLIDGDGVLMDAPPSWRFELPVVEGVGPDVNEEERKERMHRVEKLLKDLAEQVKQVAEIDVSERDNLKVVQELKGRAVTLVLGKSNFRLRYLNFMSLSGDLLQRLPNAVTFDLRLEDQVTAAADGNVRTIVDQPVVDQPIVDQPVADAPAVSPEVQSREEKKPEEKKAEVKKPEVKKAEVKKAEVKKAAKKTPAKSAVGRKHVE